MGLRSFTAEFAVFLRVHQGGDECLMQVAAELARQAQAPTPRIYPLYQSGTTIRLPSGGT